MITGTVTRWALNYGGRRHVEPKFKLNRSRKEKPVRTVANIGQSHAHCIQAGGRDEGDLVKFDASVTKEQKRDFSDFELAMIAGVFHKLLIYWGFHAQASPGLQVMVPKE